jgi:hypothetical protein
MQKRLRLLLALFPLLWSAKPARADSCVTARVERRASEARGDVVYEIDFLNHCATQRSLFWCAENPAAAVPAHLACPSPEASGSLPVGQSYLLSQRRRFQWQLPPGTRIRYHDCPAGDRPTLGFGCSPAPAF